MQNDGNSSNGLKLNEVGNDRVKPTEQPPPSAPGKAEETVQQKRRFRGLPINLCLGALGGILLAMLVVWIWAKPLADFVGQISKPKTPKKVVENVVEPSVMPVTYGSFVIPLTDNETHSYVAVNMTFSVQTEALRREMVERSVEIRSRLYDVLLREINRLKRLPQPELIETVVLNETNKHVRAGFVEKVHLDEYLAI